jgi:hypothetical protein
MVSGMTDLHKALSEINAIRGQIARSAEFRGYGPATLSTTGIMALLAAAAQAHWLKDPAHNVAGYLVGGHHQR